MELRQLRYFTRLAETLNFSEAARLLCITQSTLSQQIRALETELDVPLFVRNSHGVSLTEEAQVLLPEALATLRSASNCVARVSDLRSLLTGSLHIGVTYSFAPLLSETLLSFAKAYPHVHLCVHHKSMDELLVMTARREIDFALAFRPITPVADVDSHVLFDNRLALIVPPSHALARKRSAPVDALSRYPLMLPMPGMQARDVFDELCRRLMLQVSPHVELSDIHLLLDWVLRSPMITVLSEVSVEGRPEWCAVPFDLPEARMEGCVHFPKGDYRRRSTTEFLRMLSESVSLRRRVADFR